jgi:voltage-gated potassium channel Kch
MVGRLTKARSALVIPIILFFAMVFLGAYSYTFIEGWSYLDALYFSVSTATTLGYGDLVPITSVGKIFTIIFAFLVISLALYFFTLIGRYFIFESKKRELVANGRIKHHRGIRRVKV